jgi:hypothetical protein
MDETFTAVTKQWTDEGSTLVLRVGEREYSRVGLTEGETRRWWYAQASDSQTVTDEVAELLDALVESAHELSPEEPKPLDVDDVYDELLEALVANRECQTEELGHAPSAAERFKLCPSELAMQLYYRDDSVAVAAVTEALERPYLNYGTLNSVFGGTLECC